MFRHTHKSNIHKQASDESRADHRPAFHMSVCQMCVSDFNRNNAAARGICVCVCTQNIRTVNTALLLPPLMLLLLLSPALQPKSAFIHTLVTSSYMALADNNEPQGYGNARVLFTNNLGALSCLSAHQPARALSLSRRKRWFFRIIIHSYYLEGF